jgi:hypothetical protein
MIFNIWNLARLSLIESQTFKYLAQDQNKKFKARNKYKLTTGSKQKTISLQRDTPTILTRKASKNRFGVFGN